MHLLPVNNSDERAGYPSASDYDRLLRCRASYLLSRRAHALGQLAHQWSPEADLGTKKHVANMEDPEALSEAERADWQTCQTKRDEFIRGWANGQPFNSVKEQRLWLRKGIRPLLTGKQTRSYGKATEPPCWISNSGTTVWMIQARTSNFQSTPCWSAGTTTQSKRSPSRFCLPLPVLPGSIDLPRGEKRSRKRYARQGRRTTFRQRGSTALSTDPARAIAL